MKLISENLHIISKKIKEAILSRDENFITELIKKQVKTNPDWIDLNIGPAKKNYEGTMEWLVTIVKKYTNIPISFDSTNSSEIENGLKLHQNTSQCIINSTSADEFRLNSMTELAAKYDTYLIALTLSNETGIPKFADQRLELAFQIIDFCNQRDIKNEKIIFDPLILPVCVDQQQAFEAMSTIRMIKESFEPQTLTTIGLSNVSNGIAKEQRPLINRVFFTLAAGCGLDTAIVDSFDSELLRINNVLETEIPQRDYDTLLLKLYNMMQEFGSLSEVDFNKNSKEEIAIYKTAQILLNEKIYTNSYLEI